MFDAEAVRAAAAKEGLHVQGKDVNVLVHHLFERKVEHHLKGPVFVYDYPAALCPLTKRKRGKSRPVVAKAAKRPPNAAKALRKHKPAVRRGRLQRAAAVPAVPGAAALPFGSRLTKIRFTLPSTGTSQSCGQCGRSGRG